MKRGRSGVLLVMVGLLALGILSSPSVRAQLPPAAPVDRGTMGQVLADFFQIPISQIRQWEVIVPFPDLNLPVALFIAQRAHVSVDLLLSWRKEGKSWLQIATQLKVPPTVFFVSLPEQKLGPPYGQAYSYYWKHQRDQKAPIPLSDGEIADLVHLRITSSYFKLSPGAIMALRAGGKSFSKIYALEYAKRHPGKGQKAGGEKDKAKEGKE